MKYWRVCLKLAVLVPLLILFQSVSVSADSNDPLPSWNEGSSKNGIIDFVGRVTKSDSPDFVAPEERIATFDNDGTLWSEKPFYFQLFFAMDRVKALAPQHPEWKTKQPFKFATPEWQYTLDHREDDLFRATHELLSNAVMDAGRNRLLFMMTRLEEIRSAASPPQEKVVWGGMNLVVTPDIKKRALDLIYDQRMNPLLTWKARAFSWLFFCKGALAYLKMGIEKGQEFADAMVVKLVLGDKLEK